MKALLICRQEDLGWAAGLGWDHLWSLPVLDQPLIRQNLETLKAWGCTQIRCLTDHHRQALEAEVQGDPPVTVRPLSPGSGLLEVLHHQKIFFAGEDALVIPGPLLLGHAGEGAQFSGFAPLGLRRGSLGPWEDQSWTSLSTPRDYYLSVLELLKVREPSGIWQGSSVKIHPKARVQGPCALGAGVQLGGGSKVLQSVLGPGVQVGPDVVIQDKLVFGTTILEPRRGTRTRIDDPKILAWRQR